MLGSTNRKEAIDEAFLRRMHIRIYVGPPRRNERVEILKLFLARTRIRRGFDYHELARRMKGFSGSTIKDCCTDACRNKFRTSEGNSGTKFLELSDFFTNGRLHHTHRVAKHVTKPAELHSFVALDTRDAPRASACPWCWEKRYMILVAFAVFLFGLIHSNFSAHQQRTRGNNHGSINLIIHIFWRKIFN